MESVTAPGLILLFGMLAMLALADLYGRSLPGIGFFFLAAVVFGLGAHPWLVGAVVLAVGWGGGRNAPGGRGSQGKGSWRVWSFLPALVFPAAWPVLLAAAGVRQRRLAQGDLLALAAVACLTPWYGSWLAFLGVLLWSALRRKQGSRTFPALPGMLLGALATLVFSGSM